MTKYNSLESGSGRTLSDHYQKISPLVLACNSRFIASNEFVFHPPLPCQEGFQYFELSEGSENSL